MTPDRSGERLVRYTFGERVVHTLAAMAFLYLLLTGLALWTPGLYWIAVMLGGGFVSRLGHPWAGVIFTLIVVWMLRVWQADMRSTDADRTWRRALLKYIRNEDADVPGAGRFNYGQKVFFWVMVWGTLALLLSGIVLWIPEAIPADLRAVRQIAILVHAAGALVLIGAFIVHVYMGVAIVPGSVDAIVHGEVSRDWARRHHPLWADEHAATRSSVPQRARSGH
jgi:formate dehydrogenase subunit gamma